MDDVSADVLAQLSALSSAIAAGQYEGIDDLFAVAGRDDIPPALRDLAEAFGSMVVQIEAREFRLGNTIADLEETTRQLKAAEAKLSAENVTLKLEVDRLRIEIDHAGKEAEVAEITDNDYFQTLQARARQLRRQRDAERDKR